jgi:hypothetical protein
MSDNKPFYRSREVEKPPSNRARSKLNGIRQDGVRVGLLSISIDRSLMFESPQAKAVKSRRGAVLDSAWLLPALFSAVPH